MGLTLDEAGEISHGLFLQGIADTIIKDSHVSIEGIASAVEQGKSIAESVKATLAKEVKGINSEGLSPHEKIAAGVQLNHNNKDTRRNLIYGNNTYRSK